MSDIPYAYDTTKPFKTKVIAARPFAKTGMLLVTFENGEKRWFDTWEELDSPMYTKLRDVNIFMHPSIINGVVSWDNESIDIAPEYMYDHSCMCIEDDVSPYDKK